MVQYLVGSNHDRISFIVYARFVAMTSQALDRVLIEARSLGRGGDKAAGEQPLAGSDRQHDGQRNEQQPETVVFLPGLLLRHDCTLSVACPQHNRSALRGHGRHDCQVESTLRCMVHNPAFAHHGFMSGWNSAPVAAQALCGNTQNGGNPVVTIWMMPGARGSIFQFRNDSERRVLNLSKLTLFGFDLTHRCFFALLAGVTARSCARCSVATRPCLPAREGVTKPLEHPLDKRVAILFGNPKCHLRCPVRSKVCSFASSMLITMPRIMTDPANQSQTHFILEEAHWKRHICQRKIEMSPFAQSRNVPFL